MRATILVLVNVVACAVLAAMMELYLRHHGVRPYARSYPGQPVRAERPAWWAEPDPVLGWTVARTVPGTNREGFRHGRALADVGPGRGVLRIMVLGDSFAYGVGVSADDAFPGVLQSALGREVEVYNLGIPGWGIDQMYLAYRRYRDDLQPAYVVLAFIDDDVSRVLESHRAAERLSKPSFALAEGALVPRGPPTRVERALDAIAGRSALVGMLAHELHLARDGRPIVRRIIAEMARETMARGERFAVVRLPLSARARAILGVPSVVPDLGRRANDFRDVVAGANVVCLDPWDELGQRPRWEETFYLADGHLSARGHYFVAKQIARHVFGRNIDW